MRPDQVTPPPHLDHLRRDPRGYPALAVVERDANEVHFRLLSEMRKVTLACFDWCSVCGLPFQGAPRWQVQADYPGATAHDAAVERAGDDGVGYTEAPMHEVCALYAGQICPWLLAPTARFVVGARAGIQRTAELVWRSYEDTVDLTVSVGDAQRVPVFAFRMGKRLSETTYVPAELAARYERVLAKSRPPTLRAAERSLTRIFADVDDHAVHVSVAAGVLGMAFIPDHAAVLPGEKLVELAEMYAQDPAALRAVMRAGEDPYARVAAAAAFAWERQQADALPSALRAARAAGAVTASS